MNADAGAHFTDKGTRRVSLYRRWGEGERWLYVGLNPSTAGTYHDDQSTRKMRGFAERNGAGRYEVRNLFDLRATDPKELYGKTLRQLQRPDNLSLIIAAARDATRVLCIWGRHGSLHGQAARLLEMFASRLSMRKLYALRVNADGSPAHVLMLPYDCQLIRYP